MTESKLFVSSCSRRELAVRRRGQTSLVPVGRRVTHPMWTALAFIVVCGGAFLLGRGGI